MRVRDVMASDPLVTTPDTKLGDAAELMLAHEIRHLPVCEGENLIGMISDRDVRSLVTPRLVDEEGMVQLKARYDAPVSEVMAPDVVSLTPESGLEEAVDLMIEQKIGALTVIDPTTGALLGILSYIDVLRAARSSLQES